VKCPMCDMDLDPKETTKDLACSGCHAPLVVVTCAVSGKPALAYDLTRNSWPPMDAQP